MDRNRFIQCMKSNVELSDKERRRIIRKSVESQPWKLKCTIAVEIKVYDCHGRVCGAYAGNQ